MFDKKIKLITSRKFKSFPTKRQKCNMALGRVCYNFLEKKREKYSKCAKEKKLYPE